MSLWTIDQAQDLLKDLAEPLKAIGWHCALAGGVLLRGYSDHDLDIVLFPSDASKPRNLEALRKVLVDCQLYQVATVEEMHENWRKKGSNDTKHVEVWIVLGGKRIDLIIWP